MPAARWEEDGMKEQLPRRLFAFAGGLVVAAILAWSVPALAHHGWAGYEDKITEFTGTVETPVSVAGPHASLKVRADGQLWDVMLAPPAGTERAGLKDGMIPKGEKVVVHGQRHRDPQKFEIKTTRLTWNGRVFNVYPGRD
jgi:hypothetical protein